MKPSHRRRSSCSTGSEVAKGRQEAKGGRKNAGGGDLGLEDMSSGEADPDTYISDQEEEEEERTASKGPDMPDVSKNCFF